jgi:hypothetical protein
MMDAEKLRQTILSRVNPPPVGLEVEGMGQVFVCVQTAYAASQTRAVLEKFGNADHLRDGRTLARILCDAAGELLFDAENDEHALALSKLDPAVSAAIFEAAANANRPKVVEQGKGPTRDGS